MRIVNKKRFVTSMTILLCMVSGVVITAVNAIKSYAEQSVLPSNTITVVEQHPVQVAPAVQDTPVVTTPKYIINITPQEKELMAKLVVAECQGESFNGKAAALETVLHRLDKPKLYGSTVTEVITKKYAYSSYGTYLWDRTPSPEDYAVVEHVLTGHHTIGKHIRFYYAHAHCKGTKGIVYVTTIGKHTFGYDPTTK